MGYEAPKDRLRARHPRQVRGYVVETQENAKEGEGEGGEGDHGEQSVMESKSGKTSEALIALDES